jgi:hypothetical protein
MRVVIHGSGGFWGNPVLDVGVVGTHRRRLYISITGSIQPQVGVTGPS